MQGEQRANSCFVFHSVHIVETNTVCAAAAVTAIGK